MNDLMRAEWDQWRLICDHLVALKTVTADDLNSPVHADKTVGQRLLADLRCWGDLRARQGAESSK